MKKYTVIAPVGKEMDKLFVGIKEFPTEKIILIAPTDKLDYAEQAKKDLDKFGVNVKVIEIKGNVWEETFKTVAEIKNIEKDKEIIVNISTGDTNSRCAATSAAFVNGIKAFDIQENEARLLPILKFSYYKLLTDKKMDILKLLENDKKCCASLEELSKKTAMSLSLISYHINGNLKSEGLKNLGLVETSEKKGKMAVTLSLLGRMLVKGYIT